MTRALAFLLLALVSTTLHATLIVPAEFREIVGGSQVIVYGRVTDVRAEWIASEPRRIDSIVTLDVSTYLKGGPGESVTFRVPGGTIGRYRSTMVGAPQFSEGDEVVLFLRSNGPAIPHVFGLSQGVYRVRVDERTGQRLVVPPVLMATGDAPQVVKRGAADRKPVSLDTFGAQVRAALEAVGR